MWDSTAVSQSRCQGQGRRGGWPDCALPQVIPSTEDSEYLFRILSNGSIILNGSLSYNNKSAFYQLKLVACVSGGAGTAGAGALGLLAPLMEARLPAGLRRHIPQRIHHAVFLTCLPVHLCD